MNKEEIIRNMLLKTAKNLKEMLANDIEVKFEEEKERLSRTTDKIADIHFKLEVVLKQK